MRNELDPELQTQPGTRTFDAAGNPAMINPALTDSIKNQPLSSKGLNTEQGIRFNLLGAARKTSTQYTELNKRLEQYNAERKNAGTENAQQFNADLRARDAKAAAAAKNKNPNDLSTLPKVPADPVIPADPAKPKVKKTRNRESQHAFRRGSRRRMGNVLKKA